MKHNKGEVWKVSDRNGNMTICLLEDVDESKDMFFEAVIFSGKKEFISQDYQELQEELGKGDWEEKSSFRTGLCKFKKRLNSQEENYQKGCGGRYSPDGGYLNFVCGEFAFGEIKLCPKCKPKNEN